MDEFTALEIIYQDKWIVAINKPAGLLVHKTPIATNTTTYALQTLRNQLGIHVFPIHRLDRKTSGVLLFAKDRSFVYAFQQELSSANSEKIYNAIVRGYFPQSKLVDYDLTNDRGKTQSAVTDFELIEHTSIPVPFGKFKTSRYSLIEAHPKTGRMHQIRKHLNHLRHPIIGDRPHGCNKQNKLFLEKWGLTKMLLHAYKLKVHHPYLKENITLQASIPTHYIKIMKELKFSNNHFLNIDSTYSIQANPRS